MCCVHGGSVPPIRKAEDPFFDGHDVQFHFVDQPAAERRASTGVFLKAEGAQAFGESSVVRVRGDFGDDIGVECRTHLRCGLVGDEQFRGAASDKNHLVQQRTQAFRYLLEKLKVSARHIPELSA